MQRPAADRWCQDRDRSADQLRCCRGRSATARVAAADGRRRFGSLWASLVMLRLAGLGRVAGVAGHSDRMCSRRSTLMTALERFDLGLLSSFRSPGRYSCRPPEAGRPSHRPQQRPKPPSVDAWLAQASP